MQPKLKYAIVFVTVTYFLPTLIFFQQDSSAHESMVEVILHVCHCQSLLITSSLLKQGCSIHESMVEVVDSIVHDVIGQCVCQCQSLPPKSYIGKQSCSVHESMVEVVDSIVHDVIGQCVCQCQSLPPSLIFASKAAVFMSLWWKWQTVQCMM